MAAPIDDIATILHKALSDAIADREDELTRVAVAGGNAAGGGLFGDIGKLSDIIGTILEVLLVLDPPAEGALQVVKAAESAGGKLGSGFGIGYLIGYAGWQMFQPALLPLQNKVATIFQSQLLDPDTSAKLVSQGIWPLQTGRDESHGNNLGDDRFDQLVDSARTRPDEQTLLTLLNRGEIDEEHVAAALAHHGYDEYWAPALTKLRKQLLLPPELALAVLKGALADADARAYAERLGVDSADFDTMLLNTGEPPGTEQLLEAYRRTFIDKATLEHGIRQGRVRDEWIPTIEQLRYSPMSSSDAVRAVVENYLTDEEGQAIAEQNGLLPEHWRPLVESWGRPLSHEQMLTLYHRGQATLDEVRQAMRESDVKNQYIDKAIELGRTLIPERTIVSMVDHGVIDGPTATELLAIHGYTPEDAARLIALGAAQRTSAHKTLTKGDTIALYTDALINRADALDHLAKLGYQGQDANEMLDLADYKRKASTLKVVERGIQASLKAHHITEEQALAQLATAGLDHNQAQVLVDEWLQERGLVTRTLTEAQTIKAAEEKLIGVDDARTRLAAMGYGTVDIDLLLKMAGLIPA